MVGIDKTESLFSAESCPDNEPSADLIPGFSITATSSVEITGSDSPALARFFSSAFYFFSKASCFFFSAFRFLISYFVRGFDDSYSKVTSPGAASPLSLSPPSV